MTLIPTRWWKYGEWVSLWRFNYRRFLRRRPNVDQPSTPRGVVIQYGKRER